jgi:photosystem II stability/assembly factor-like uncharacterized protein
MMISCISSEGPPLGRWKILSKAPGSDGIPFVRVMFFDEMSGLALTTAYLAKTTDGGQHWSEQLRSKDRQGFSSMLFLDHRIGWIVGEERGSVETDASKPSTSRKPVLLETVDSGISWRNVNIEQFERLEGVGFSGFSSICAERSGTVWIVGDAGIVKATIESGVLRSPEVTLTRKPLNDVSCSDGEVWAVGEDGLIMQYSRNRWAVVPSPQADAFFNRVKITSSGVWVLGGVAKEEGSTAGLVLYRHSRNEWENKTPFSAGLIVDLDVNQRKVWLIGVQGTIYLSNNDGETWQREVSPTANDLYSIFMLNKEHGWIGGDGLTMLGRNSN